MGVDKGRLPSSISFVIIYFLNPFLGSGGSWIGFEFGYQF